MRANQSDRLVAETEEQREARLQRMCANQSAETDSENRERPGCRGCVPIKVRLAAETEQQREARLQRDREGQQPQLPLLELPSVQT